MNVFCLNFKIDDLKFKYHKKWLRFFSGIWDYLFGWSAVIFIFIWCHFICCVTNLLLYLVVVRILIHSSRSSIYIFFILYVLLEVPSKQDGCISLSWVMIKKLLTYIICVILQIRSKEKKNHKAMIEGHKLQNLTRSIIKTT